MPGSGRGTGLKLEQVAGAGQGSCETVLGVSGEAMRCWVLADDGGGGGGGVVVLRC